MAVSTLFTSILVGISFILTFDKKLRNVDLTTDNSEVTLGEIAFKEKVATVIMGIVPILWMTESLHSINSAIIALLGTLAMFSFKIIEFKDFKSLNIRFMIFITAAFAIGGVMNQNGQQILSIQI